LTAVLCYTTNLFSLILSDNRVSYGKYAQGGYSDDYEKLVNLKDMGWAAGAGAADYLDELKQRLAVTPINNVEEIIKIYQEVSDSFSSNSIYSGDDIDMSAAVASWLGFDEHLDFFKFNIGILSPNHIDQEGLKCVGPNQIFTLYPVDYLENENKILDLLNRHGCEYQFDGDLNTLYKKVFSIFKEIAQNSDFVSSSCDIGLHMIQNDGIYKIRFSGEIDNLIQEANENSIHERYIVVSKIGRNE
jgi:hypothetical protein